MKKARQREGKIIVYTDGGARGNPGPAAIGVVIAAPPGRASPLLGRGDPSARLGTSKTYGEYIGERTNNQAEYEAAIFALKKIKQLIGKSKAGESEIEIRMDSELVVKQLNGEYKILEEDLQPLFLAIWNLKFDFKKVGFMYIPREKNHQADVAVNKTLDSRLLQ